VSTATKILYRPLGLGFGVLGGIIAGALFKQVWKVVAGEDEEPEATDRDYGWAAVVGAAALQGALFGAVKAAVDRGGAEGFRRLTGSWPGE
jgi:Protein of unknown function (DUF4235)